MPEATLASESRKQFDTEFLFRAPEIYVFSACSHVVDQVAIARAEASSGKQGASRCEERARLLAFQLWGLAAATQRFDIIVPLTSEGDFSPYFWRWFNWWTDYREGLSPEELDQVHGLLEAFDPAALEYRPPGDWLNHRSTVPPALRGVLPTARLVAT